MAMLTWVCTLGILGLTAPIICSSEFFYTQNTYRRSNEICSVCFEKDCLTIDKARCDYYAEAAAIVPKDVEIPGGTEDAAKRKEVDELMFELVEKGLYNNMECIPYISRYTNCNKANVCLGCKTCACDPEGRWNCTTLQPCHNQDPPLNIDHRVLVMIMEAITDHIHPGIKKRSVMGNPKGTANTITYNELSEWLYGAKPFSLKKIASRDFISTTEVTAVEDDERANEVATTVTDPSSSLSGIKTTAEPETTNTENNDSIGFEDVLRDIAVDSKPDRRRMLVDNKPFDNETSNQAFDYMIMDEDDVTKSSYNNEMMNFMLDYDNDVTESTVTDATEVVINLLETAGNIETIVNVTEDYTKYEDPNIFKNMNDIIEHSAFNIMKRDVAGQENITAPNVMPTATIIVNTTNITTSTNTTEDSTDLNENILIPLNKIITEKIKELETLQKIKDGLLKFIKSDTHPEYEPKENNLTSNTYFSIYNVAMAAELDVDLWKVNPNIMYEKYMKKLKRDLFEVMRDLHGIRKYNNTLPDDLKMLVHAMRRYVYKNKLLDKPMRNKLKLLRSFRRSMEQAGRCDRLSIKECLVQVLEVIDQDTPKLNALYPLSPATKKIMKHIIKSYYVNQFIMPGLRLPDPHYNLTNYLNSVGKTWREVSASLIGSTPFASLYRMKLLHCTLTMDISKMNDAAGIIEFAHSRRMTPSLDKVSNSVFDKIDAGLTMVHNKIQMLIKYYSRPLEKPRALRNLHTKTTTNPRVNVQTPIGDLPEIRKKKKHSFLKHIRNLLKFSKHDIKKLLLKKVPKSEIIRQLAKERLDEISEKRYSDYEETMKRWQENLNLAQRMKRSVLDQFQTRIKNIIPKYLRHKVNPKIKDIKKNATAKAEQRNKNRKEKKASRYERKARKTTTPSSRKHAKIGVRSKRITIQPTTLFSERKARKTTTPSSGKHAKPVVRAKRITIQPRIRSHNIHSSKTH